jgi:CBS domain containing-hemolysin-like protein
VEIAFALGLAAVGIFLSAFFSGTEIGFYRATRVRMVLDALGGDRIVRGLVWLTNHPLLFIATVLVGNNLANYLTALAIVMATQTYGYAAELIAPLVLAPVLFVYGELLPKGLFLQAPNRLLRRVGPLFLVFLGLFLPISALLWGLNKLLARFVGESPEQIRLTLARRELQWVLEEGHEAGILHPAQRGLARGIFAVARQPVARFATPLGQLPQAHPDMTKDEVLRLARRHRISLVPVESSDPSVKLAGYYRVIDLGLSLPAGGDENAALNGREAVGPLRRLLEITEDTSHVAALMRMQSAKEDLARVVNADGETLGIVTADRLREPLFHGGVTG